MGRFRNKEKLNIRHKLLLIFVGVFVIPVLVFAFLSYMNLETVISANATEANSRRLEQSAVQVGELFAYARGVTRSMEADTGYLDMLHSTADDNSLEYLVNSEAITNYLSKMIIGSKFLISLYLYGDNGQEYCINFSDGIDEEYDYKSSNWYVGARYGGHASFLVPHLDLQTTGKSQEVVSYVSPLVDKKNGITYVVKYNFPVSILTERLDTGEAKATSFLLTDDKDSLICQAGQYPYDVGNLANRLPGMLENPERISIDGRIVLANQTTVEGTPWKLYAVTDAAEIMYDTNAYKTTMLLGVIIMLIVLGGLSLAISSVISRPIKSMERIIEEVRRGEPEADIVVTTENVHGIMRKEYQNFADTINNLLREINLSHRLQKDQELQILQAQINPHFIYNTLAAVRWAAKLDGNERTEEAVSALIDLLKSAIRLGQLYIPISDEISQIRDYIILQELRYDGRFRVVFDIGPDVQKYKTLKFVMQPIVENAIFHGLDMDGGDAELRIAVKLQNDKIIYLIEDNGAGMDEGQIRRVLESERSGNGMNGIGVNNVNQRIRKYFGTEYGISIESRTGWGTRVSITIPAILFEEPEDE